MNTHSEIGKTALVRLPQEDYSLPAMEDKERQKRTTNIDLSVFSMHELARLWTLRTMYGLGYYADDDPYHPDLRTLDC